MVKLIRFPNIFSVINVYSPRVSPQKSIVVLETAISLSEINSSTKTATRLKKEDHKNGESKK
jgi:hypothetical protein